MLSMLKGRMRPGMMGSWTWVGTLMRGIFGVVLRRPFLGHFMCPFDIVGLEGRCLATTILERW